MKRKEYQEPAMEIVRLQQGGNILAASQQNAEGEDFTWDED